jgi:hypothetical protein
MLASKVSTSHNTSYIAFLLGACVVSQSHALEKAASDIHHATAVSNAVISHCILVMFVFMVFTSSYNAFFDGA